MGYLSTAKIHYYVTKNNFYGTIFTSKWIKPDPTKIQAIQDLPTSKNQTKLQSFLGLINNLQPFIPGLSSKINFLQEQLSV